MPSISSSDSIYSIRKSILGDYSCIPTPLGPRKLTYADCTASGRSSSLIEKQINERVLPLSANTHTSSSYTGYSCHNFLDESRSIIRDSVNASITEDAVIFCGRGATAASNLLVHLIASTSPTTLSTTLSSSPSSVSCLKQQRKSKHMSATTFETENSIKSTLDDDDTLLTSTSIDTDTIKNNKDKDKEEEDNDDDPKSLLHTKYTSIESKEICFSEKCTFPGCDRIFQIVNKKENTITVNDSKKRKTRFDSIYRMLTNLILHSRTHSDGEASANDAIRRLTTYQKKEKEEEVEEEEHTLEDDDDVDINDDDVTDTNFHVIVGPFAHNSSYLPWKEFGAKITHIPSSSSSLGIDIFILLKTLRNIHKKKTLQNYQIICVLTSASNVTGQLCGTLKQKSAITALIHAYNGIVIWDYAATASHFPPEMNNSKQSVMSWNEICTLLGIKNIIMKKSLLISLNKNQYIKNDDDNDDDIQCLIRPPSSSSSSSSSSTFSTKNDAIFFSMHKFVGGGGGGLPGVLVIKRSLLRHTRPNLPGGGTVFFVSNDGDALYTGIDEEREEGGTPDVAGCARASLCLLLCRQVGWETIRKREASIAAVARREWSNEPNIIVVGHTNVYKKKRRLNREENEEEEEEEDDDDDDDDKSEAEAVPIISLFFKYQSQNLSSSSSSSPLSLLLLLLMGFSLFIGDL
jgi:selenocysteine lyase/cysteine desulfurase